MIEKAGDSWVPMDASFKQYDFTAGMALKEQVPFDAQALVASIEAQLTQFQNQLKAHIENQNPDATVGEVLGLQDIKTLPARPLAAGLPYNRLITSKTFNEVPNNLRHKFKYTLATSTMGYADSPFITLEEPTAIRPLTS